MQTTITPKVFKQYELVRKTGAVRMLDADQVATLAEQMGHKELAEMCRSNSEAYTRGVKHGWKVKG